ncbi:hypothetical protein PENTCL1PPCAC_12514, partial [Pristionchus entomophagus]
MKRKKKNKKKNEKKQPEVVLRPREIEDPSDVFCKSEMEAGKEEWEKWIAKTGGIVRGKKSRQEVLKLRAEKKAAKEKRLEEEKKAKEEKKTEAATTHSRMVPAPSLQLATDEFLTNNKKKQEIEDRFITIGPTPPTSPAPPVTPPVKRQYKRNSAPPIRDDEIKFEPPTESKDASVLKVPATEKKAEEVEMMTATNPLMRETNRRLWTIERSRRNRRCTRYCSNHRNSRRRRRRRERRKWHSRALKRSG